MEFGPGQPEAENSFFFVQVKKNNEFLASPAEAPKTQQIIKFGPGQPEAANSRFSIKV